MHASRKNQSSNPIHKPDAGRTSVRGAQEIISAISTRRTVTKLVLGHSNLGNEGTNLLFRFLESPLGRKYPISEISLNSNGIGDEGLLAISRYLKGNHILRELFLQANAFIGDPTVIRTFVDALNSSRVKILSLTTNLGLGDGFIEQFLPALRTPELRELHISTIGLTRRSVPHIADFLRSPERCQLHTLACNGNSLGLRGVRSIIKAIEQNNYSLVSMEFYANQTSPGSSPSGSSGENRGEEVGGFSMWKACQTRLLGLRARNTHLKHETERQALGLLRYSRALLLHTSLSGSLATSPERSGVLTLSQKDPNVFPFMTLPTELKLTILSLLAPSLSSFQRSRIFSYAAAADNLPPLLPSLKLPHSSYPGSPPSDTIWTVSGSESAQQSGLGVMNTASCNREKERVGWLDAMGCSSYEREAIVE